MTEIVATNVSFVVCFMTAVASTSACSVGFQLAPVKPTAAGRVSLEHWFHCVDRDVAAKNGKSRASRAKNSSRYSKRQKAVRRG